MKRGKNRKSIRGSLLPTTIKNIEKLVVLNLIFVGVQGVISSVVGCPVAAAPCQYGSSQLEILFIADDPWDLGSSAALH
jgi:hypothetical protein